MTRGPSVRLAILLVDDDAPTRRALGRLLTRHDVTTAAGVVEARTLLRSAWRPQVVISDFHLSDGSGLDVLEVARRLVPNARRILFTSAPELVPGSVTPRLVEEVVNKASPRALELLATL